MICICLIYLSLYPIASQSCKKPNDYTKKQHHFRLRLPMCTARYSNTSTNKNYELSLVSAYSASPCTVTAFVAGSRAITYSCLLGVNT